MHDAAAEPATYAQHDCFKAILYGAGADTADADTSTHLKDSDPSEVKFSRL